MTMEQQRNVRVSDQVKGVFGPPPVLSTEQPEQFEELFRRMVACLKPRDTVELILIRHFVYALWEIERLTRYGTVAIERRYREAPVAGAARETAKGTKGGPGMEARGEKFHHARRHRATSSFGGQFPRSADGYQRDNGTSGDGI